MSPSGLINDGFRGCLTSSPLTAPGNSRGNFLLIVPILNVWIKHFECFLIKSRKIRNDLWVRCKHLNIQTKNSDLHTTLYQWADLLLLTFYPDYQTVKQLCLLFRLILLCAKGTHTLPGITAVSTPNKHTFIVLTCCFLCWPLMQNKPLNLFFSISAIVLYITSYWCLISYRCLTSSSSHLLLSDP